MTGGMLGRHATPREAWDTRLSPAEQLQRTVRSVAARPTESGYGAGVSVSPALTVARKARHSL
jgi:hypothetical protein